MTAAATSGGPLAPPASGVFPVLCTPFDERGGLDLVSLDRLVDYTLATGAQGLTVGGVASEVAKLADDERRTIVERVLGRVGGRVPVWVGTGHQCTELTLDHTLHAERQGAAGIMVMPPWVAKPSLGSLAAFFRDLDLATRLPIMIQDAPLVSGLHLPVEWLVELAGRCGRVRAVKVEAPPTGPKIADLVARGGGRIALVGGLGGANLVSELDHGAVGTLPGGALPGIYVQILARYRAGDRAGASTLHQRALPLIRFVSQSVEFSYHAYKEILRRRSVLGTARVRQPSTSFGPEEQAELTELLLQIGEDAGP